MIGGPVGARARPHPWWTPVRVLLAVFTVLSLTFVLLTAGALGGNANIGQIGGYAGLVTAALAWYGSMAGVANNTWKKAKLPTFPFSA